MGQFFRAAPGRGGHHVIAQLLPGGGLESGSNQPEPAREGPALGGTAVQLLPYPLVVAKGKGKKENFGLGFHIGALLYGRDHFTTGQVGGKAFCGSPRYADQI